MAEVSNAHLAVGESVVGDRERAAIIRAELPGQRTERAHCTIRSEAQLRYGQILSWRAVLDAVARVAPRRLFFFRDALATKLEVYRGPIPDEALLAFDEAQRTGLFSSYWIVTPRYESLGARLAASDPWLVAQLNDADAYAPGFHLSNYVVLAHWD